MVPPMSPFEQFRLSGLRHRLLHLATNRKDVVFRVAAIEHFRSIDPRLQHMCVNAERIAGKHDHVSVFADFERSDAILHIEHYGVRHRQCIECLVARHSGANCDPTRTNEPPRIRNAIIRMKPDKGTRFLQSHAVLKSNIRCLKLSAR